MTAILRGHYPADRYAFDWVYTIRHGWCQVDTRQDAHYFGIWTNPLIFQTVTYCEGDLTIAQSLSQAQYRNEILNTVLFHDAKIDIFSDFRLNQAFAEIGMAAYVH